MWRDNITARDIVILGMIQREQLKRADLVERFHCSGLYPAIKALELRGLIHPTRAYKFLMTTPDGEFYTKLP